MTNELCQLAVDWDGTVPDGGMMCDEKLDGFRAMYFAGIDGVPRLWTRAGMAIEGTEHIRHRLSLLEQVAGCRLFVDGEFVVDGALAATKTWCERGWRSGEQAGVFHAFDVLRFDDWRRGGSDMPLYERKAWLQQLIGAVDEDPALSWDWREGSRGRDEDRPAVVIVPDEWIFNADDALDAARRVWVRDGEGCMLKIADAPYARGRNGAWRKVKASGPWQRNVT